MKKWKDLDGDTRIFISIAFGLLFFFNFAWGLAEAWDKSCHLDRVIQRFNPAYLLGCAIAEPRWRKP